MNHAEPLRNRAAAFFVGAPIGFLGGLIGLGGAEFRLPVLKALFRYPTARVVSLNLLVSLVTLFASLAIRARVVETQRLPDLLPVVGGLIVGSMAGAYVGASFASRISARRLERLILILLVALGSLLVIEAFLDLQGAGIPFGPAIRVPLAALFGLGIGVVSSLLGVAGGELLIPTHRRRARGRVARLERRGASPEGPSGIDPHRVRLPRLPPPAERDRVDFET